MCLFRPPATSSSSATTIGGATSSQETTGIPSRRSWWVRLGRFCRGRVVHSASASGQQQQQKTTSSLSSQSLCFLFLWHSSSDSSHSTRATGSRPLWLYAAKPTHVWLCPQHDSESLPRASRALNLFINTCQARLGFFLFLSPLVSWCCWSVTTRGCLRQRESEVSLNH